jgi:uncharacterized membrane protein YagU involved in acid resistance
MIEAGRGEEGLGMCVFFVFEISDMNVSFVLYVSFFLFSFVFVFFSFVLEAKRWDF